MPVTTYVDTFLIARLYGTSANIVLGAKGAGSSGHAAIQIDALTAKLADLNKTNVAMKHAETLPTESEARTFLSTLLPASGGWDLAPTSDIDEVHYYRPSGWITGEGFAFGFQLRTSGTTVKRSVLVDGQALTVDYLVLVQPHV